MNLSTLSVSAGSVTILPSGGIYQYGGIDRDVIIDIRCQIAGTDPVPSSDDKDSIPTWLLAVIPVILVLLAIAAYMRRGRP